MTILIRVNDNVNYLVTPSIIAIGKSYSAIEELLSNLDIPGFSLNTFAKYEGKASHSWNEVLTKSTEFTFTFMYSIYKIGT
jgi:hypothetical protein